MKRVAKASILLFATFTAALLVPAALAWGPHPQITRAAQDVLPEREQTTAYFGKDWLRLQGYCLMPDWRRSVQPDFYPDDFLLWPDSPTHINHMVPDVKTTYQPFFQRALLALRTETPQNAARWIGSLIHYVEDSGAPCHAAAIKGEMHKRLENWLDAEAISIANYQPQLLGHDEPAALAGFLRRMDGLLAFSKERAEKIYTQVEALQERQDQPVIMECANESARAVADVLHTLLILSSSAPAQPTFAGRVTMPTDAPLPAQAAKVMLLGTPFSTLADSNGCWQFRNLPARHYRFAIERAGCATKLDAGTNAVLAPSSPPGNLIRNSDFTSSWLTADVPDHWTAIAASQKFNGWESDNILIRSNAVYRIGISGAAPGVQVGVRWRAEPAGSSGATNIVWSASPEERELTPPTTATWAQVLVVTKQPLTHAAQRVWLVPAQ